MTNDAPNGPARPWKRWALIAVMVLLVLVLYSQLKDFGGELYRFFS